MADKTQRVMKSIKPRFFQFENPGDMVAGKFVMVDHIELEGLAVPKYLFDTDEGRVGFLGTVQISETLATVRLGTYCEVEYTGDAKSGRSRTVKEFDIRVEADTELLEGPATVASDSVQE